MTKRALKGAAKMPRKQIEVRGYWGGTARRRIDAIEKGRRGVVAATAKQIADVLGIRAGRILDPQGEWWESR